MLIKFLKDTLIRSKLYKAGQNVDVDEERAKNLIAHGLAAAPAVHVNFPEVPMEKEEKPVADMDVSAEDEKVPEKPVEVLTPEPVPAPEVVQVIPQPVRRKRAK